MDFQKFDDNKVISGYSSMLLYKLPSETLYHLLIPLETTPSVFGSTDTFEYDVLTSKTKGQVEGKVSLEQKDVDFLWHRDNVMRLESLGDAVIDFMVVYKDFTARKFTGTIDVKPQDASNDILRGTFTITPRTADTNTIYDARPLIQDTAYIISAVPDSVVVDTTGIEINVETNPTSATLSATVVGSDGKTANASFTATVTGKKIAIKAASNVTNEYALVKITVSAEGMAPWTTTIAVTTSQA